MSMKRSGRHLSSFACKVTMAVTGLIFAAFVLAHMVGNLKAFIDPAGFDEYARWLRVAFAPVLPHESLLWGLRLVLLACLCAHVGCAAILWRRARAARGTHRAPLGMGSFVARTMPVTGLVLLGFIVFHLLDLTTGHLAAPGFVETTADTSAAYANLVASFQRPWAAAVYLVTMLMLWAHLAHGLWTLVNDLGVSGKRARAVLAALGGVWALAVLAGNAALPIAVWAGWLS